MVQNNRETAFTVRCDTELKEKAESLAKEKGQSLVEWVRRAMKLQIVREESLKNKDEYMLNDDESIEDRIITVIQNMKKEGII